MFARRLVVIIMLVAFACNFSVLAAARPASFASEGQAFTLTSLNHETVGAETRLLIQTSAPPLYTLFRPSERLIIVDMPGGESAPLQPQYAVKSQLVDMVFVRQSRSAASGRVVTRIEINVNGEVRDRSTVKGNTLVIELAPDSQAVNARYATEKSAGSGVYVYPTPTVKGSAARSIDRAAARPVANHVEAKPERAAPKPAATRAATLIQNVRSEMRGSALRIVVDTNGAAQFKDFVLPNPWRIVVDITGVHSSIGNKTEAISNSAVERLRVGQPGPNVVRLVLDAKAKINYRIERDGESLIITVGDHNSSRQETARPDLKAQSAASPAATVAENKPVETKAEAKPEAKSVDTKVAADTKAAEAKPEAGVEAKSAAKVDTPSAAPATPHKEVKVAGQRVENKTASSAANGMPSNLIAQNQSVPQQGVRTAVTRGLSAQPGPSNSAKETITTSGAAQPIYNSPAQPSYVRSATDVPRNSPPAVSGQAARQRSEVVALC